MGSETEAGYLDGISLKTMFSIECPPFLGYRKLCTQFHRWVHFWGFVIRTSKELG